jgi:ATP-dependent protease ClpP protease subunit
MHGQPTVIKFFAPVIEETIHPLLETIDAKMRQGAREFVLLISSPGGDAFYGISAYNYLRGLPIMLTTHNFGTVDSMGVVLFCSGRRRLSVPQARFLLHGVSVTFTEGDTLEESQFEERLKEMRMDAENIAKVIAASTGKPVPDITNAMLARTTLNPEEAKAWGLVHDIKSELFESGSELISIQYPFVSPPEEREPPCRSVPDRSSVIPRQGKTSPLYAEYTKF